MTHFVSGYARDHWDRFPGATTVTQWIADGSVNLPTCWKVSNGPRGLGATFEAITRASW
jgi:hypothetical protein